MSIAIPKPNAFPPVPWHTELLKCNSQPGGCRLFCYAIFCPACKYGDNVAKMGPDETCCGGDWCCSCCSFFTLGACIPGLTFAFTGIPIPLSLHWIIHTVTRGSIRVKYNLEEESCGDCCVSTFCMPCSLAQEDRELRIQLGFAPPNPPPGGMPDISPVTYNPYQPPDISAPMYSPPVTGAAGHNGANYPIPSHQMVPGTYGSSQPPPQQGYASAGNGYSPQSNCPAPATTYYSAPPTNHCTTVAVQPPPASPPQPLWSQTPIGYPVVNSGPTTAYPAVVYSDR